MPNAPSTRPVSWDWNKATSISQTKLPLKKAYLSTYSAECVANAIGCLGIRGALLICIGTAFGIVPGASKGFTEREAILNAKGTADRLKHICPAAANQFWTIGRTLKKRSGCP
jgi:methylthioribose-1-phosphate isomerase